MILRKLFELITVMEAQIGNNCMVTFAMKENNLLLQCSWYNAKDYRERYFVKAFSEDALKDLRTDDAAVQNFVALCKKHYKEKQSAVQAVA